jgi:hypothetical protein
MTVSGVGGSADATSTWYPTDEGDDTDTAWLPTEIVNTSTYDLPADFASFEGALTYAANATVLPKPIDIASEHSIRSMQSLDTSVGRPTVAAIRPKTIDMTSWTKYEILFFPAPQEAYVLTYRYHVNIQALSDANNYPPGTQAHAETILVSCLAAAEQMRDRKEGIYTRQFADRLAASVSADRTTAAPDFLGYNRDDSDGYNSDRYGNRDRRDWNTQPVTYNGITY